MTLATIRKKAAKYYPSQEELDKQALWNFLEENVGKLADCTIDTRTSIVRDFKYRETGVTIMNLKEFLDASTDELMALRNVGKKKLIYLVQLQQILKKELG